MVMRDRLEPQPDEIWCNPLLMAGFYHIHLNENEKTQWAVLTLLVCDF